jgi:tRNA (guanine-N7-)-methyltransferase
MTDGGPARRNLYGRRRGHRLRQAQKAVLQRLLPALAVDLGGETLRTCPLRLFDPPVGRLWLEIGFGAGEHLAWQAEAHPEVGLIGAEPFANGVAGLLREVERRGLGNVRVHAGDARDLLDALPRRSLSRVFVLFPDPWPKARHHRRRLVNRATLDRLAALMVGGAELRIATDDPGYQAWILQQLLDDTRFEWLARRPRDWRSRPADWPPTRYEAKAIAEGRRPAFIAARRRLGGGEEPADR